ncbi:MAG: hypothetical protein AB7S26_22255 [Sandaracinaceae bacterium]
MSDRAFKSAMPKPADAPALAAATSPGVPPVVARAPIAPPITVGPPRMLSADAFRAQDDATVAVQAPDPRGLFERSRGVHLDEIDEGMMVCRARVSGGGYDDSFFAGGADVYVILTLGSSAPRRAPQSGLRMYTYPVTDLHRGDPIHARVMDRDLMFDDLIGQGGGRYEGGEVELHAPPNADVVCRPVRPELFEEGRARARRRFRAAVDRLEGASPALDRPRLGFPSARAMEVLAASHDVLPYVSLSSPSVAEDIERAASLEDRFYERAADMLEADLRSRPEPGARVELPHLGHARIAQLECGADSELLRRELGSADPSAPFADCVAVLELELSRETAIDRLARAELVFEGIDRDASIESPPASWRVGDGPWQAPIAIPNGTRADRATVALVFPSRFEPVALALGTGNRRTILRAR